MRFGWMRLEWKTSFSASSRIRLLNWLTDPVGPHLFRFPWKPLCFPFFSFYLNFLTNFPDSCSFHDSLGFMNGMSSWDWDFICSRRVLFKKGTIRWSSSHENESGLENLATSLIKKFRNWRSEENKLIDKKSYFP